MPKRTNQEWLAELKSPEHNQAGLSAHNQALVDLRALLVRGLGYAVANRYHVPEADLEDFAQEALLKILDGLDTFRGESLFTTWANKIAINVAFSELRRLRWKDVSLQDLVAPYEDSGDFTPEVLTDSSPSPEQRMNQRMMIEKVQEIINEELTDRQRTAMIAVMMEGMPIREVARRMGSNRNALYKLLHDARSHLKARMQLEGISPQKVLAAFE
ncbi:MAG: ECF RNA polymerase sigma-E factor [Chloroflexi bacterium]|nr:ECF RNA polymerase sigma-E factor [Chloroflexota bacterium]